MSCHQFFVAISVLLLYLAVRTSARVRIEGPDGALLWITDTSNPVTLAPGEDTINLGTLTRVNAQR